MNRHQPSPALPVFLLLTFAASPLAADGISDNSFFIEEAYNQEPRVVQHIGNLVFADLDEPDGWTFAFTQEWPAPGQRHQLSYTLPFIHPGSPGRSGDGDVLLNYRYQLEGTDATAIAPRVSLIVPTGDEDDGLGDGSWGLQLNLPVSHQANERWVLHGNVGATWLADAKAPFARDGESLVSPFAGGSAIFLARPTFNLMFETLFTYESSIGPGNSVERNWTGVVSPGLRWAINRDDLQIVPGIALPVIVGDGEATVGAFFYLSFEHPF